ncbi:MAG: biotin/lipoyl-containing protein, partial [Pseudomonadota bacterium]
ASPRPAAARAEMGAQAVALAKAVNYDSAGTVEFVASQDADFYFLEMNTRLQVEHPVTELVTGVDLVEQMIRVAAGEPLSLCQDDICAKGWAVESRLYAEDPDRGFLPSIGRLRRLHFPEEVSGETTVRVDSGVVEGSEISRFYDPMIAKIITHGPTRADAIETMSDALDEVTVEGIRHNGTFLAALMAHPRWREGALSTSFIATEFEGKGAAKLTDDARKLFAAAAMASYGVSLQKRGGTGFGIGVGVVAVQHLPLSAVFDDGVRIDGAIGGAGHNWIVTIDGTKREFRTVVEMYGRWSGITDQNRLTMGVSRTAHDVTFTYRGMRATLTVARPRVADLMALMPEGSAADGGKKVLCPMPGLVVSLSVKEGDKVEPGQQLAVIEAMKMENVIRAEQGGTVKSMPVSAGDSLAVDAVILELE